MTGFGRNSAELASAYEGLDDPSSFPDRDSLLRYRNSLLERTGAQADFLMQRIPRAARVLEIGCGNGRLLVELARRGALQTGLGLDLAASRIEFARTWAREERLAGLEFDTCDALQRELPDEAFTTACCITGAFAYFDAFAAGSAAQLARKLERALQPGGLLCLELYPHPAHRRLLESAGGSARIWTELPPEDPWRFYLSKLSLDETGDVLTHQKTFIHRTDGRVDSGRRERLRLYTDEGLTRLLADAGFGDVRTYEGWSAAPYDGGEIMLVTALTASPT